MDFESEVVSDVCRELFSAREKHGNMASAHEAYAVILEELDEFKEHVWRKQSKRDPVEMRKELIQIAAMAMRAVIDLRLEKSPLQRLADAGAIPGIPGGPLLQPDGDPAA